MKVLSTSKCIGVILLLALAGCGATQRVGKDFAVVVTSPATILLNGVHDGVVIDDKATMPATEIMMSPVRVPLHMAKHGVYTCLHALDILWSPFYMLAAIDPNHDLAPLEIYSLCDGYPWDSSDFPIFEPE